MQKQHIHVRTGEQGPAAITAERRDADSVRSDGTLSPQLADQCIDEIRTLANRGLPVVGLLESLTYVFRLFLICVL
jgi:hypothetical protein